MNKIEMSQLLENSYVKNLHNQIDDLLNKKVSGIELPYVLRDQVLMAPGTWNGKYYNADAIKRAFKNSDWESRKVNSVFAEHFDQDKVREGLSGGLIHWLGFVANPRIKGEEVLGDVVIFDEGTAIKVDTVKKLSSGVGPDRNIFGISPRLMADENAMGQITDFVFENFSLVFNPAVKKAFINNSQKKEGSNMSGENTIETLTEEVKTLREEIKQLRGTEDPSGSPEMPDKKKKMPPGMPSTMKNAEGEEDSKPAEGEESGESGEESGSSEGDSSESAEKTEAKLSEKELAEIVTLAEFPEFAAGYRKENPEATLSQIAEAFKTNKNSADVKQLKAELSNANKKIDNLEKRLNEPEEKHANIELSEVDKTIKENPDLMKEEALDHMMMAKLKNPGVNLLAEIN